MIFTNQMQSPVTLVIWDEFVVRELNRNRRLKSSGCMFTAAGNMGQNLQLLHHIDGQWSLANLVCPIGQPVSGTGGKLRNSFLTISDCINLSTAAVGYCKNDAFQCFPGLNTLTLLFSSGDRAIYKNHGLRLDIAFRELCRTTLAPPSDTGLSLR